MIGSFRIDRDYAHMMDQQDELASFRSRFVVDDPDLKYLDGNSLGRTPLEADSLAHELVRHQWGNRLIRGWNEGWFEAQQRIGAKIAQLIGAEPDEVILADSTSVNLFKLVVAALAHRPGRTGILTDDLNFPSDLYVLQGAAKLLGGDHTVTIIPSQDGVHGPVTALEAALAAGPALLTLSHTSYKSGYRYDMGRLTSAAHGAGAYVLWDLSHSVGAMPIDVGEEEVDLAVGCTYKYLCGGPGAPAFLYVRRDLQNVLTNPISGWMGQQDLFAFEQVYRPASGLRHFLTGTPPVISTCLIEPGVDIVLEAGLQAIRAKSVAQTEYLFALFDAILAPLGFNAGTPRDPDQRGSHLALRHKDGLAIDLALIEEMNVVPDFRAPETLRLGIAPLYTSYEDILIAVERIRTAVVDGVYARHQSSKRVVT